MEQKKLYIITHNNLTGYVQTAQYNKWIHVVYSQSEVQSENEVGKTSIMVLRMSEISLHILRAKSLSG